MKIHALTIALALAAGSALAAAPNTGDKADAASAASTTAASTSPSGAAPVKKSHKKSSKKKHTATHVSMKHHGSHVAMKHHSSHVAMNNHGTHVMGAGPMSPSTDLQASSRQARIDQAYSHWHAKARS